jgi:hypothetical protein
MTAEEFVAAVRSVVMAAAVTDTVSMVERPPGRRPAADLVALAGWYRELGAGDRAMVDRMLAIVSRSAVFGLFAVLDGARKVDPAEGPGDFFELRHVHGTASDVLSGPRGAVLHELL